eukprot:gene10384-13948_t
MSFRSQMGLTDECKDEGNKSGRRNPTIVTVIGNDNTSDIAKDSSANNTSKLDVKNRNGQESSNTDTSSKNQKSNSSNNINSGLLINEASNSQGNHGVDTSRLHRPRATALLNGQIIEANQTFRETVGLSEAELKTMNLTNLAKFDTPVKLLESAYELDQIGSPQCPVWKAPLGILSASYIGYQFEIIAKIDNKSSKANDKHSLDTDNMNNNQIKSSQILEVLLKETREGKPERSMSIGSDYSFNSRDDHERSMSMSVISRRSSYILQRDGPLNVLIVDDSITSLKVMTRMISNLQHIVSTATNGLDALELMKNHDFDIVLMDLNMPMMGGLDASFEFRKIEKARKHTNKQSDAHTPSHNHNHHHHSLKLVAMTSDISNTIIYEVTNAGFDAFIPKPLTEERFAEVVEMYMKVG